MAYTVGLGVPVLVLLVLFLPRILLQAGRVYFPSLSLCRSCHAIIPTWNEMAKALWATKPARPIKPAAVLFTIAWLGTLILNVPLTAQILETFFSAGPKVVLPLFGPLYTMCLVFALVLAIVRAGLGFMLQGRGARQDARQDESYPAVPVNMVRAMLGLIVAFQSLLAGVRGQVMAVEGLRVFFLTPEITVALVSGLLGLVVPLAEVFFGGLSLYEFFDPAGAAALRKVGAVLIWLVGGFLRLFIAFHDPETLPQPTPRALSMLEKKSESWLREAMFLESALTPLGQHIPALAVTEIDDLKADVEKLTADITEFTRQVHESRGQSQAGVGAETETTQGSRFFALYTELGSRCVDIQGKARNLLQRRRAMKEGNRGLGRLEMRLNRLAAAARYWQDRQGQLRQTTVRLKDEAAREYNEKLLDNLMATLRQITDRTSDLQEITKTIRSMSWGTRSPQDSVANEAAQILACVRRLLNLLEEAHKDLIQATHMHDAWVRQQLRVGQQALPVVPRELSYLEKKGGRLSGIVVSLDGSLKSLSKRVEDASAAGEHTDLGERRGRLESGVAGHVDTVTSWARAPKAKGAAVEYKQLCARGRSLYLRCSQFHTDARRFLGQYRAEWRAIGAQGRRIDGMLNSALGQVRGLMAQEGRLQRTLASMDERDRQYNKALLENVIVGLSCLEQGIVELQTAVRGISAPFGVGAIHKAMGLSDDARVLRARLRETRPLLEPDAEWQRSAARANICFVTGSTMEVIQVLLWYLVNRPPTPFWIAAGISFMALGGTIWLWGRTLCHSRSPAKIRHGVGR